jgi:transcriptional regulator with PAS, ATPase and Fis domain
LTAREIHKKSYRSEEAFISVDMAALSESLFESELFGHVKGAYTDAKESRPGRFEIASGGTLFLDEIGNLSLPLQAKLLTVLQNREIIRLGSNDPVPIDIRLICATNMPLYDMVDNGDFREDLLYRINTVQIEIPPLRERKEDIPLFIRFFLKKYKKKYNKPYLRISETAIDKLSKFNWPGNIRQLDHIIENVVILSENDLLKPADFIFHPSIKASTEKQKSKNFYENEKKLIETVIKDCNGHLTNAAKELGIGRATLYRKLKKYGI